MVKKYLVTVVIVLSVLLVLKACIRADIPPAEQQKEQQKKELLTTNNYIPNPKNVTINGVDYLQSQAPTGKFGGKLVTSTIGEGPKTFNPWNSKDATSSSLSEIMFDSLVTTNVYNGEVEARLAKSFTISPDGKTYTFKLRKGVNWSDGKPITAKAPQSLPPRQ